MNSKVLGFAILAGIVVAGCTPQTRDEYKQAGNEAAQAMKQDTKSAAKAAQSAGTAAKDSLNKDSASQSGTTTTTTTAQPTATAGASQIAQNVSKALGQAAGMDSSGMTVQASGNDIVLKGTVASSQQKSRAEEIAKGVCGSAYTVKDNLQVAKG